MMKSAALWSALASAVVSTQALDTAGWKKQSIYQIVTDRFATSNGTTGQCSDIRSYCGGSYQGIIDQLDYIQGMGFTAIWISPIVKNIEAYTEYGNAYHGYWAQDIESLNEHFGTEDDLIDLSDELHNRNMYLMVDVVTNHMGYNGCQDCVDYSIYTPFDSQDDFHSACLIDYDDDNSIVNCWEGDDSVSLPDLKTEKQSVRDAFNTWISNIITKYGIDGLRVDSTQQVEKSFFPQFSKAADGIYMVGEVFNGDPSTLASWSDYISGVMNYGNFYWIADFFSSDSTSNSDLISGLNTMKSSMDTNTLGSFIENHDNPRFASRTSDAGQLKSATAFGILADGIPIVYYGQEQQFDGAEDPNNREVFWSASSSGYDTSSDLYKLIASLNAARTAAISAEAEGYTDFQAVPAKINDYAFSLRKGGMVSAFSNMGAAGAAYNVTISGDNSGYGSAGVDLTEVLGCESYTTGSGGSIAFEMTAEPKVFYKTEGLASSGVCDL